MINIQQHQPQTDDQESLYDALDQRLRNSPFDGSAAQAHGIACGLVCRDIDAEDMEAIIEHLNFSDSASIAALGSLIEMAERDLNQAEFAFDLWLPEVDALNIQLEALADWSQGFIIGLLHDGAEFRTHLNAELNESIQDMIEISGLDANVDGSTEDEVALFELKEYLRMVTQLIYEELNPDRPIGTAHD